MFRKLVTYFLLVPLAIVILMFASANRETVTLSFDPFSTTQPALSFAVPLFVLIFILVIFGVILGGFAAWLRQSKYRRHVRLLETEVRVLRGEKEALLRRPDTASPPLMPEKTRLSHHTNS
jgi:uncharacterized integral membrane protein